MQVNQCELVTGNTHTITWVPRQWAKKGQLLRAGKDKRVWEVIEAYRNITFEEKELKTDWKVGGLK